mmetsp:Transcript_80837/g.250994  ORF Transcript_80837/g.250994 Transcript_80837/m.250994 type:complete len:222 (+) Transcript_80837:60-725(+)
MSMLLQIRATSTPTTRGREYLCMALTASCSRARSLGTPGSAGSRSLRLSRELSFELMVPLLEFTRVCGTIVMLLRRSSKARMKAPTSLAAARSPMRSSSVRSAARESLTAASSRAADSGPAKTMKNLASTLVDGSRMPRGDCMRRNAATGAWPGGKCSQTIASTWQASSLPLGSSSLSDTADPRSLALVVEDSVPSAATRLARASVSSSATKSGKPVRLNW